MKRILFVRRFRKRAGGHITVRDFFLHAMAHPDLDPYLYVTPGSDAFEDVWFKDVWAQVPPDRVVREFRPLDYDLLLVGGRNWRMLPDDMGDTQVINLILHIRHATNQTYSMFLGRPAFRIADAQEVADAIAPMANGPVEVIHEAIDFDLFPSGVPKVPGSVLIFGQKNPNLGDWLARELRAEDVDVTSFNVSIPHAEFAQLMARSEIFVGLPNKTEGFYRPPVEAMSCGTAVVCSDAIGSRIHLIDGETCLQPDYDDPYGYLAAIRQLLSDDALRQRLQTNGLAMAQRFSLSRQRQLFHNYVDRHIFGRPGEAPALTPTTASATPSPTTSPVASAQSATSAG